MIEAARLEAQTIREAARQEGYDVGYKEGERRSEQELLERKLEFDDNAKALQISYEQDKDEFVRDMEHKVAYVIRELVGKMVGKYEDDPSLIVYLIKLAFEEVHTYGSFVIKVSGEDFDYVMDHKDELTGGLSEKVEIEILKDVSMVKNQCFIETQMGNIDCSLNLRVDSLSRELRLIGDSLK